MSSWHWDGKAECPKCRGRGVVSVPDEELPPYVLDATRTCACVLERDLLHHIERTWTGLSEVTPVSESKLSKLRAKNVWLTASVNTLRTHLAKIAREGGVGFHSKVITDLDLMTAWLYSANEIYDADVSVKRSQSEEAPYTRITDMTEGWDLLIIRLGVKAARNQAAPEVLMEALLHREQLGKPTWIVDSDSMPFGPGHIDYNAQIVDFISGWDRVSLDSQVVDMTPRPRNSAPTFTAPPPRPYVEELDPSVTDEFAEIGLELFGSRKKKGMKK